MPDSLVYFNGVHALTGDYSLAPKDPQGFSAHTLAVPASSLLADLSSRKQQSDQSDGKLAETKRRYAELLAEQTKLSLGRSSDASALLAVRKQIEELERFFALNTHAGVRQGVNPLDLAQTGWGIIFPASKEAALQSQILEALGPLLDRRRQQAGDRFRMYVGASGYRTRDTKSRFLSRHGAAPAGPASPEAVPYYLLLIGSPEEIPFEFQYHLDIQYAVGRLYFDDMLGYHHYARSVVETELSGTPKPRKLTLFGVQNPGDPATEKTEKYLTQPLADALSQDAHGWEIGKMPSEHTSQSALASHLGGSDTSALLFVACHGIEYPTDHPLQRSHQGALLGNQWSRTQSAKPLAEDSFFAAHHLASTADVAGMLLFAFACYSAGAPRPEEYPSPDGVVPSTAASTPFVSGLPMALLGHPRGGALCVIGHVERAWGYAYGVDDPRQRSHTAVFHSALSRILLGHPVGHAMEFFNEHYAERATALSELVFQILNNRRYDPLVLGELWCESADARGYVVLGDPAARLCFAKGTTSPLKTESVQTDAAKTESTIPCPPEIPQATWNQTPREVQDLVARLQQQLAARG